MYDLPCNTAKHVLNISASDQIARVKARRVCKGLDPSNQPCNTNHNYESNMMLDNQRKIC